MRPWNPEEATASSRKCSRSTPETAMTSASARAAVWEGVISCSWAEALGARRNVRLMVSAAPSGAAPTWVFVPEASVLSRERSLEAAAICVT